MFAAPAWSAAQFEETDSPDDEESEEGPRQLEKLGDYEQRAVRRVLRKRNWSIDPNPGDKTIEDVQVVTLPVFGVDEPDYAKWLNQFHATTEPFVVRREVLVEPGEPWKQGDIDETERNLRDPTYTSLVVALPVETADPETVRLLVVVRDIWSLRANANFEYQGGILSKLFASVSESNLLGRHKSAAAIFDMDLGSFGIGPLYRDPNVLGSRVEFQSRADLLFERATGAFEGTRSDTTVRYPLWNLDRTWGGELSVSHTDRVVREFRGAELLEYDDPRTREREAVPYRYQLNTFDAEALALYGVGESVEHRLSFGYGFEVQDPEIAADFEPEGELRRHFRRDVLPPRERNSGPIFGYRLFVPKWRVYRNIDSYDLPEEKRLGPYAEVRVTPFLEAFGSLQNFVRGWATVGGLLDIVGQGFVRTEVGATSRYWAGRLFDNELHGAVEVVTPPPGQIARLVARGRAELLVDDTQNRLLFAGGQTGLRGYQIGARAGARRILLNVELRSLPLDLGSFEFGALAFWDAGDAAERLSGLRVRHDVGGGVRLLIPQLNTIPLRLDWAFPIAPDRRAWPGRVSVGFGQAF